MGGMSGKRKLSTRAKRAWKRIRSAVKTVGTLNIVLIVVAVFFAWFNCQLLDIYRAYGSIPETYACAVIAATIGECGICGWIRTTKDRKRDRQWEAEDREREKEERNG